MSILHWYILPNWPLKIYTPFSIAWNSSFPQISPAQVIIIILFFPNFTFGPIFTFLKFLWIWTSLLHCSVQFSSVTQPCPTLCDSMNWGMPGFLVHYHGHGLKFMSIDSVIPSNHLIFYPPLLLPPSIFPSIRVFPNESVLHIRWPKYWSFSFNISPSNEHPGLISFRMHWVDLLAVQGTLRSLLQYHSSKASVLRCSAFFIVQRLYPYLATGKTIALTRTLLAK